MLLSVRINKSNRAEMLYQLFCQWTYHTLALEKMHGCGGGALLLFIKIKLQLYFRRIHFSLPTLRINNSDYSEKEQEVALTNSLLANWHRFGTCAHLTHSDRTHRSGE